MMKMNASIATSKKNKRKTRIKRKNWFHFLFAIPFIAFYHGFYRVKVEGKENIPRRGGFVIMANHLSHLDSFIIGEAVFWKYPWPLFFPADTKLWKNPIFKPIVQNMNTIPVFKGSKQLSMVRYAAAATKLGYSVVYYPEGARTKDGRLQPGKLGSGLLAHISKAPIVPCFIKNAEKAMPVGKGFKIGRGPRDIQLEIIFGRPLNLKKYYDLPVSKETSYMITLEIMNSIRKLGKLTEEQLQPTLLKQLKEAGFL